MAKTKKNPLKELTKYMPSDPEIEKLMMTMATEPDYIAAITGVSLVEAELGKLILLKLKHRDKNLENRLFGFEGPLGTFSGKIAIAGAFGFITSPMMKELDAFRNIRNAFAHSRTPLSFSHPEVSSEVAALTIVQTVHRGAGIVSGGASKSQFLMTLRIILLILQRFSNQATSDASEILNNVVGDFNKASEAGDADLRTKKTK